MLNSNFSNTTGLNNIYNKSTALDVAKLAFHLLK